MMSSSNDVSSDVQSVASALLSRNWTITTAESCTGGMLAAAFTEQPGSSAWFHQSIVSYSNDAKTRLLGVTPDCLVQYGAVSEQTVCAMADGAQRLADAQVAIAISGIAGPDGGSPDKPVGTVWIGWKVGDSPAVAEQYLFSGDRRDVRVAAVREALRGTILRLVTAGQ